MRREHLVALLLVIVVAGVFFAVPSMDFVRWDDQVNVYENPYYRPVTLDAVADLWEEPYFGFYIPVTRTVWAAIARATQPAARAMALRSQPFDASAFHAANLVLHAANVLLVFAILRVLGMTDWSAGAGAALFAVHPVQVEPVAWVTGFKDLLGGFLALLALLQYLTWARRGDGDGGRTRFVLAMGIFAVAILAKQTVAVLPALAWALDALVLRRGGWRAARSLAWWLPISAVGAVLARWTAAELLATDVVAWWQRPLIAGDALAFYLGKLFVPTRLMAHFGRAPAMIADEWWIHLTWLAPAALVILLVAIRRRHPTLTAAGAVFLLGLTPVIGLVPFGNQDVTCRFMYLPMLGAALALAWVVDRRPSRLTAYATVAVLALLAGLAMMESFHWTNTEALFARNLALNPRSWAAHEVMAKQLQDRGELQAAETHYRIALAMNPDRAPIHANYGVLLSEMGRWEEALAELRAAAELDPDRARHRANLGSVLLRLGRTDEAAQQLRMALELNPRSWEAHTNLGAILLERGEEDAALRHMVEAVRCAPDEPRAHEALGVALRRTGQQEEARKAFKNAERLRRSGTAPGARDGS